MTMRVFEQPSRALLGFLLAMMMTGALAAPNTSRPRIGMEGPVDAFSVKSREIVIMDFARRLAPDFVVIDRKGKVVSAFHIGKGTPVKLELNKRNEVQRIILLK